MEVKSGDILVQDCNMVDDYTGKESIEPNRLLVMLNEETQKLDVKCIDAMAGYRNNFWGCIPRFDRIIGNVNDGYQIPSDVEYVHPNN